MKNTLLKESLREIRHSKNRFISILAIVAIGSGFFSGVKAACPDMKSTAEDYLTSYHVADLHLLSSWGFNEDDISALNDSNEIRTLEAGYSKDFLATSSSDDELVIKAIGYNSDNTLNLPLVKEGRLPETDTECVIGTSSFDDKHWEIGDTISLEGDGEDISETLKNTEYTVVGVVQLPQYFGYSYGTTTISDGTLDGIILISEDNFTLDVYTDVYLTLTSTEGLSIFSDEYDQAVDTASSELETLADDCAEVRFIETKKEIEDGISDGEQAITDGENELADAENKLNDARKELDDGWDSYNEEKSKADSEIASAEKTITDSESALTEKKAEWQSGMDEYNTSLQKLNESRAQLDEYISQRDALSTQLEESKAQLDSAKNLLSGLQSIYTSFASKTVSDVTQLDAETQTIISGSAALDESLSSVLTGYITSSGSTKGQYASELSEMLTTLETSTNESEKQYNTGVESLNELNTGIESGEKEYAEGKKQLEVAKVQLDAAKDQLDQGDSQISEAKKELSSSKKEAEDALSEAYQKLTDGESEYNDGLEEYSEKKSDAEQKIADAKEEIADAKETLTDLKTPEWYILDHDSFQGVGTIAEDSEKVDAIAAVFPVFFVLVAALVCLTTMTRMAEEQRTQIGTMKALGFNGPSIAMKYLLYAASASILGSIGGCLIGLKLLPAVIINCYSSMYQIPYVLTPIRWEYVIGCSVVSVLCTGIVTLITCISVLKSEPSQLMRPKSPKNGKRILLERVTPLWSKLSFNSKVTFRNLFRYKSRMFMTIVGVAGCTALILTGFGLRYAISSIASKQFGEVFTYDATLSFAENLTQDEIETIKQDAMNVSGVENTTAVMSKKTDAVSDETEESVSSIYLYVPSETDNLSDFIQLRDSETGKELSISDTGVVVTAKLAKLLSLSKGDTLILRSSDGESVEVKIEAIAETYINHYVYMSPALYSSLYGKESIPTMLLVSETEDSDANLVNSELLAIDNIQGVIGMSYYSDAFNDLVSSLNMIVWVLIFSAATLAIIVMYNLMNINVSERIRELATIKVLGFYDHEVSDYICRENTASALMGTAAGLLLGIWLEEFVVNTAEVDVVMFVHGLPAYTYFMAAGLTVVFILIVNRVVHHSLKKINMVESLKSVE